MRVCVCVRVEGMSVVRGVMCVCVCVVVALLVFVHLSPIRMTHRDSLCVHAERDVEPG